MFLHTVAHSGILSHCTGLQLCLCSRCYSYSAGGALLASCSTATRSPCSCYILGGPSYTVTTASLTALLLLLFLCRVKKKKRKHRNLQLYDWCKTNKGKKQTQTGSCCWFIELSVPPPTAVAALHARCEGPTRHTVLFPSASTHRYQTVL